MEYNDFASLVQLGVGLHAGTAILQLYGELGVQPLARALTRIKSLFVEGKDRPPKELEEELAQLESEYEIFKIRLFNEYKRYVKINTVVAVLLGGLLVVIAYSARDPLPLWFSVLLTALSLIPAPATLYALWQDANNAIAPLKMTADNLESRILKRQRPNSGAK